MLDITLDQNTRDIFSVDRPCIVNADLDGILSGMLLQKFLNWKVVGYSSCCGKPIDNLWLADTSATIDNCVFVDLPVCVKALAVIDQHFVAFASDDVDRYLADGNKVNPNILRKRVFSDVNGRCQYTAKYPFGTIHFILAALENMRVIDDSVPMDFLKRIGAFDLADLLFRADRVIGNTSQYTQNCLEWIRWLMAVGGTKTNILFRIAQDEYRARLIQEQSVEDKLISLGCGGRDGDCSNLFRSKDYSHLRGYFSFLGDCLGIECLPVFDVVDFNGLTGGKINISTADFNVAKEETKKSNVFSFAMVSMRTLSITYRKRGGEVK